MPEMKKPQVLQHPGLRGNVEIYEETNVMHDHSTATAQVIPFRQKELLLVGNAGEPFVPMKPVVEGMGLAWQSQHRKLQSGRFATCITEMVIQLPGDTQRRPVSCLPLRKLTGWLMSIHPNKVRPELREGIIAYQGKRKRLDEISVAGEHCAQECSSSKQPEVTAPVSRGFFMPAFRMECRNPVPINGREGDGYNTRKGKKSTRVARATNLPATSMSLLAIPFSSGAAA
ncbi:phage antirepressor N-terminal domain-containing protein [Pseudomonas aeruginosa]|uniref:phage antirepressor N-terminal domain-containing protein n=1 Tax=Pseudomonas aeruginosa TaxID=287 RepID=UPI001CC1E9D6|nr:phage antirepressor N-terminal domain-containing protein [Pseudomonas aeruginosa]MDI2300977.1 phage antirepressor N-terminal domain-containing protein [Pseudomonas aeruginosa]